MEVNLSLNNIAEIVGGTLFSADSSFLIKNIASLENATSHDLAIVLDRGDASVFDAVSNKKIKACKAGCFLTFSVDLVTGKNYILVKDSVIAFQKLVDHVQKTKHIKNISAQISPSAIIDQNAIVSSGVTIGNNSWIGPQVFIGQNCNIGSDVVLHPGVKILDDCIIGNNTIIHSGAIIGSDGFGYKVTKQGLLKIPQIGIVQIGNFVEIGANCTIDRAAFDRTTIEDGVKIDNLIHIAHNVKIGACTAILAQTGIAGSTVIGRGCQIGGQVAIKNDIKIGNGVKIVSKSAVMNDLEDGATVCGIPAIPFMKWKRISVVINQLPELIKSFESTKNFFQNNKNKPWYLRMINRFKKHD